MLEIDRTVRLSCTRQTVTEECVVHSLEYAILVLSERIRHETGNDKLADDARMLASASAPYLEPNNHPEMAKIVVKWRDSYNHLLSGSEDK